MIRTLRNSGIGQVFLGLVVVCIILAFIFTGAAPSASGNIDECIVQVDKSCIKAKEYDASLRLAASIGLSDKAVKSLNLRQEIAQGFAEREVLLKEARRLGIGTSEDDIDNELFEGRTRISLPADGAEQLALKTAMCVDGPRGCAPGTIGLRAITVKQDGKFNFDLYQRSIRVSTGRSPSQFKEMQQDEYTAERVRQLIRSQVRVSPDEAFLSYSRARSQATARTVEIKDAWFARYVVSASADELEAFAKENKADIDKAVEAAKDKWAVGCQIVSEIRIDNADPGADVAADAKAKAEKLQSRAQREDFAKLARFASQSDNAKYGGYLGCLDSSYGADATTLVEAASELKRNGDVSPVVETIQGFHVLRLEDTVSEDNRDELLRTYVTKKMVVDALAKKSAEAFAKELIQEAEQGDDLSELTETLVAKTLKNGAFPASEHPGLEDDTRPKMEISRAISIEQSPLTDAQAGVNPGILLFDLKEEDDVHPEPIPLNAGFAVMQLKSKEMITREKFEEDRTQIMTTLQQRKAEQALSNYVAELLKKAGGASFNSKYVTVVDDEEEKKPEEGS